MMIRDDGERLLLGEAPFEFKEEQMHFSANSYENDIISVQGSDGYLLTGQVRRPSTQSFDGFVGDASNTKVQIESARRSFFQFFQKNHYYKVVYILPSGEAIARGEGFIVDAPEVQEFWQIHPEYHVALNFENTIYYLYEEDESGNETMKLRELVASQRSASSGGWVWDAVGGTWDGVGGIWEDSTTETNYNSIPVGSISETFPVWRISNSENPTLTSLTTGQSISYSGTISENSTLIIDMEAQTARLDGNSVIGLISGNWIKLQPGQNILTLFQDNLSSESSSLIQYREIVG